MGWVDLELAPISLAAGAAQGCVAMVEVNLTTLETDPRVAEAKRLAEAASTAAHRASAG